MLGWHSGQNGGNIVKGCFCEVFVKRLKKEEKNSNMGIKPKSCGTLMLLSFLDSIRKMRRDLFIYRWTFCVSAAGPADSTESTLMAVIISLSFAAAILTGAIYGCSIK